MSIISNQPDIHYQDNHNTLSQPTLTNLTYPQLTNTLILKTLLKTLHSFINLTGFILIDMYSDSTDILNKVLSKAIYKMKEIEKLKSYFTSKTTQFKWTSKKNKTTVFRLENLSLEDKNVSIKMESFLQLMILDWEKQSQFMEETFIFMIVMSTQENFMKNWDNHKDLLNNIKMINGLRRLIINGYLKKTPLWKSILKKNWVVVKLTLKNSSYKMIEKSLNSLQDLKALHTLYITSLLMTQFKFVKYHFQTQARIRSQSPSKGKNFPVNLHLINQVKLMQKISSNLKNFSLVKIYKFLVANIYFKDAISSQEITMHQSMVLFNLKT